MRKLFVATLVTTLATSIAMSGCSRKSDTHDPDTAPKTETEVVEETIVTEPEEGTGTDAATPDSPVPGSTPPQVTPPPTTGGTAPSPDSEGQSTCNAEWFEWVNQQVMSDQATAISEQYPSGLPEVGSNEWFMAIDKLTGGDGAHGPDGGSDEWCFMIQQRLRKDD